MLIKKVVTGIKWTTGSSAVSLILGLIQIGILARYLTKEEIGILSILTIVIGLANHFSDMGLSNSIIHFQNLEKKILDTLYFINVGAAVIIICMLLIFTHQISGLYNIPELQEFISLLSISIFFTALGQQFQYLYQRDLLFDTSSKIFILRQVVTFTITLLLLIQFNYGIYAIIYGIIVGELVYAILFFFYGSKRYRIPDIRNFNLSDSKECLRFGCFQMGQSLLNYSAINLDKIIIGKLYGLEILGFYELAYRLIMKPIALINPIFNTVSYPILAKVQNDFERLNRWYITKIKMISAISFPIFFGMFALSSEIVLVLYGEGWDLTAQTFKVLWILGVFWSIGNPMGPYFLALGKPDYAFYINSYQLVLYSCTLMLGGFLFGYLGMVTFFVIIYIIATLPIDFYMRRILSEMSVISYIKGFWLNLILAIIMCLFVLLVKMILSNFYESNILILIICTITGFMFYVGISLLLNKEVYSNFKLLFK